MPNGDILVIGGTGKTGRRIVERLGRRSRAASRSGPTPFDWADERTWGPALDGVAAAYVVDSQRPEAAAQLARFAERGVRRLVFLSARDWGVSGGDEHLACERAIQASGGEWTILRPTWFMQNFSESYLHAPVMDGRLVLPAGDGREPFVDAEDIAAVAAAALTEDGHAGRTYELSGPEALTFAEAAAAIAAAGGRGLAYVDVSDEEYAAYLAERGASAEDISLLTTLFGWIRAGRNEHVSDGVQRVLGRAPGDFTSFARAAAGAWQG